MVLFLKEQMVITQMLAGPLAKSVPDEVFRIPRNLFIYPIMIKLGAEDDTTLTRQVWPLPSWRTLSVPARASLAFVRILPVQVTETCIILAPS